MLTPFSQETTVPVIRVVLSNAARADQLIRLWEKQCDGGDLDGQVLLAASVLMTGQQVPSPATALSISHSLIGQPAWDGLVYLALALGELCQQESLSPVFFPIIQDAVRAASLTLVNLSSKTHFTYSGK